MSTTVEKVKNTASGYIPTKAETMEALKGLVGLSLGMIVAHNINNFTKTQKPIVQHSLNGAMVIGGGIGFVKAKHPLLKFISLGLAGYGTFKLIAAGTKMVADSTTTEGINGILPDSVKASIRKFLPTFAGIDEVSGLGNVEQVQGDQDPEIRGLNLNDAGENAMNGDEQMPNGVGSAMNMAA